MCGTRSSLARSHKGRFEGEILKVGATGESNQKSERVNRDSAVSSFRNQLSAGRPCERRDPSGEDSRFGTAAEVFFTFEVRV